MASLATDYMRFEGEHIAVDLFPEHGAILRSPSAWLQKLDAVYEAFADLVGGVPYSGERITIREVPSFQYGLLSGNPVLWNADLVPQAMESINDHDDILFGPVHELGHDFDIAPDFGNYYATDTPAFNWEHWANFKALYVLDSLAGRFSNSKVNISYYDPASYVPLDEAGTRYFVQRFAEPWLNAPAGDWRQVHNDVTTGLLYLVARDIGWDAFRRTFRRYVEGQVAPADLPDESRIIAFLEALGSSAGQDMVGRFKEWHYF